MNELHPGKTISRPAENPTLRILSLGAGVQSTTLAHMVARGDLEMIDFAVFADTGDEPARVYRHLEQLEKTMPFEIVRARRDGPTLAQMAIDAIDHGHAGRPIPPWYTADPDGMLMRQCSKEFKTRVVQAVVRDRLGFKPGQRAPAGMVVEQWIGMSWDELHRMKSSELAFIHNRWPLVEIGMRREQCKTWMADRQIPVPPKSSCVYCPYRDDAAWVDMRDNAPEDFARACEVDAAIRAGFKGMDGSAYVHKSRVPLREATFSGAYDPVVSMFDEECEGMCGV